jgi:AP-3 complex subunit beta
MSGLNLNAISENASRLGMRLQESFSEHTRDLAIARGTSSVYLDASDENVKNIAKQLDSSSDREKLHAMKKLVAVSIPISCPRLQFKISRCTAHLQRS